MLDEYSPLTMEDGMSMADLDLESLISSCSALGSPIQTATPLSRSHTPIPQRSTMSDSVIDPDLLALSATQSASIYGGFIQPQIDTNPIFFPTPPTTSGTAGMLPFWENSEEIFTQILHPASLDSGFPVSPPLDMCAAPGALMLSGAPPQQAFATPEPTAGPSKQSQPAEPRYKRCTAGPGAPAGRAGDKAEILRKARERRRELVGEIDRAKVELWETTIEQGVLTHMMKEQF